MTTSNSSSFRSWVNGRERPLAGKLLGDGLGRSSTGRSQGVFEVSPTAGGSAFVRRRASHRAGLFRRASYDHEKCGGGASMRDLIGLRLEPVAAWRSPVV